MSPEGRIYPMVLLLAALSGAMPGAAQEAFRPTGEDFDAILARVAKYDFGQNREPAVALNDAVRRAIGSPGQLARIEDKLCELLGSAAPPGAKDAAARELGLIASERSVPTLSRMLADPQTAEMARLILERIPGESATEALRRALAAVSGKLRVGIVNSLAVRGDPRAVPVLRSLAGQSGQDAEAAIAALGHIATAEAVQALKAAAAGASAERRTAIGEALLAAAERLLRRGNKNGAAGIYSNLWTTSNPEPVRVAALRGLAASGSPEAARRAAAALSGGSPRLQTAAIQILGQAPGPEITRLLVSRLPSLPPARQVQAIAALAARGNRAALPAVRAAASSEDPTVKTAAVLALADLGDPSAVRLLAAAAAASGPERETARNCLARLRGSDADAAILAGLSDPDARVLSEFIRAAGERGISDAAPRLLELASARDGDVRRASLRALSATAGPAHVRSLIESLQGAATADREELERTIPAILKRYPAAGVRDVISAYRAASAVETRISLLSVLSSVGGEEGLPVLREALRQQEVRKAAILALSEWPNPAPMNELLEAAGDHVDSDDGILALRGYIRLVALPSERPAAETVALLARAMKLATQPAEKKAIIALLPGFVCREALALAQSSIADEDVKAEADNAVERLRRSLKMAEQK